MDNKKFEKQFEKFNLISEDEFVFAENNNEKMASANLAGSPRTISKDIFLRFIKNPFAVVGLVVFISIFLMSIIIPLSSIYLASVPVSNISLTLIADLPPIYSPFVTETISGTGNLSVFLEEFGITTQEQFDAFLNDPASVTDGIITKTVSLDIPGQFNITYNKYAFANKVISRGDNPGPNLYTILGTDVNGFDLWTRTWFATRESLLVALLVVFTEGIIGIIIGSYLGFFVGTWIDNILTRFIDIIRNIPTVIWFLLFISFFPEVNFTSLFISLILIGWTTPVYQTRLWIITVKDLEFIKASQAIGSSVNRRIFSHALPMVIGKLATTLVSRITIIIFLLSSLSFLGFVGVTNDPNLGTVLNEAIGNTKNFWALGLPTIILLLVALSTQFVANGVHDSFDPKVHGGK